MNVVFWLYVIICVIGKKYNQNILSEHPFFSCIIVQHPYFVNQNSIGLFYALKMAVFAFDHQARGPPPSNLNKKTSWRDE